MAGRFTYGGSAFRYERLGRGATVVLLHAGICDSRMWDPQLAHLTAAFAVVRYDMRGYGQTLPADVTYAHHDDLRALLDHWGVRRAHLVGASFGGSVALDLALSAPDRVRSLALLGTLPGGFEEEGALPPQWPDLVRAHRAGDHAAQAELEAQIWVDGWQHRPPGAAPAPMRRRVCQMNETALRHAAQGLGRETPLTPPAIDRLSQVRAPVLLLTGALDDDNVDRAADLMAGQIEAASRVTVPGVAHLPSMERPDLVNPVLLDFLRRAAGDD